MLYVIGGRQAVSGEPEKPWWLRVMVIALAVLLSLPALYAGAYFALIRRESVAIKDGLGITFVVRWPKYRIEGRAVRRFFAPIHRIDVKHLRGDYWANYNTMYFKEYN